MIVYFNDHMFHRLSNNNLLSLLLRLRLCDEVFFPIHPLSIVLQRLQLPYMMTINAALGRMLILALVSNIDLVKVIHLISLVIMGAPRSLFVIGREFVMIQLTVF